MPGDNMLQKTKEEEQSILKLCNATEKDFQERVEILKEWISKSDLPNEDTLENKLKTALVNCKMSLEKTKRCMEGYYRIRTLYSDFFDRLVPDTDDYIQAKSLAKAIYMPKLSPDLSRIAIFRVNDPNGKASDGLQYEILAIMGAEMTLMSADYGLSNIIIFDFRDFGFRNIIKYTPSVQQTLVNILVRLHGNYESLYEYIPKDYLPSDYNGTQLSIDELQEIWCQELEKHVDEFKKMTVFAKCQRLLDTKVPENMQFGETGSFKQLTFD